MALKYNISGNIMFKNLRYYNWPNPTIFYESLERLKKVGGGGGAISIRLSVRVLSHLKPTFELGIPKFTSTTSQEYQLDL
jgi:hypothetical protein